MVSDEVRQGVIAALLLKTYPEVLREEKKHLKELDSILTHLGIRLLFVLRVCLKERENEFGQVHALGDFLQQDLTGACLHALLLIQDVYRNDAEAVD